MVLLVLLLTLLPLILLVPLVLLVLFVLLLPLVLLVIWYLLVEGNLTPGHPGYPGTFGTFCTFGYVCCLPVPLVLYHDILKVGGGVLDVPSP